MTAKQKTPRLLLFPGAGSSSDHSSLVAIEQAIAPMQCRRADFPYRKLGRRAPDRPPVLLQAVVDEATAMGPGPLVLGGRSMGGRICSMAVADGSVAAVGLVLISYPLHPPGKPDRLRVEHLPSIVVPCLFIHGTKDPFGSPAELQQWTATIPGAVTHVFVEGKGHDLKGADGLIAGTIVQWLVDTVPGARTGIRRRPG
ncbi:MAG: hydrolase of the alpha/beta-hydrolase fold family [Ilumatobacteraceae bacterium]|nr:hydrolase of the alpha/beta-hydrolase fold family [Ilumatobacteraceae bacterium]